MRLISTLGNFALSGTDNIRAWLTAESRMVERGGRHATGASCLKPVNTHQARYPYSAVDAAVATGEWPETSQLL